MTNVVLYEYEFVYVYICIHIIELTTYRARLPPMASMGRTLKPSCILRCSSSQRKSTVHYSELGRARDWYHLCLR
jgi:hypothetical protein